MYPLYMSTTIVLNWIAMIYIYEQMHLVSQIPLPIGHNELWALLRFPPIGSALTLPWHFIRRLSHDSTLIELRYRNTYFYVYIQGKELVFTLKYFSRIHTFFLHESRLTLTNTPSWPHVPFVFNAYSFIQQATLVRQKQRYFWNVRCSRTS